MLQEVSNYLGRLLLLLGNVTGGGQGAAHAQDRRMIDRPDIGTAATGSPCRVDCRLAGDQLKPRLRSSAVRWRSVFDVHLEDRGVMDKAIDHGQRDAMLGGQCGSLFLHCKRLSLSNLCRFLPAH